MWPTKILYLVAFVSSFVGALGVGLYCIMVERTPCPQIQVVPTPPHDWAKPRPPHLRAIPRAPHD